MKKHIAGIIGGMGPLSSIKFYNEVITYSQTKYHAYKNNEYPHLLISNLPIPDLINDTANAKQAKQMIIEEIKNMQNAGVTFFSIANNTVHLYIEEFRKIASVPMLSIVEELTRKLQKENVKKILLLGTPTTIKQQLYQTMLKKSRIQVITPSVEEIEFLGELIPKLVGGTQTKTECEKLNTIIGLYDKDINAIVLGCTELFLAIDEEKHATTFYDAMTILARRTTSIALDKEKIIDGNLYYKT